MKDDGFSLVELIIVIGLISIILGISTINFNSWQKKSQIESQTRALFATLNQARVDAMMFKQPRSIVLQTGGYAFNQYSSENQGRTNGKSTQTTSVNYAINEISGPSDNVTLFDIRGYTTDTGIFQLDVLGNPASLDCIVVSEGRINIGKMTNATTCTIK